MSVVVSKHVPAIQSLQVLLPSTACAWVHARIVAFVTARPLLLLHVLFASSATRVYYFFIPATSLYNIDGFNNASNISEHIWFGKLQGPGIFRENHYALSIRLGPIMLSAWPRQKVCRLYIIRNIVRAKDNPMEANIVYSAK